jgi:hypothetical protein
VEGGDPVVDDTGQPADKGSTAPPAPGLGRCVAAWRPNPAERRREQATVIAVYAALTAAVIVIWRSPPAAALLAAAGLAHAAAAGRTRLAAGNDWLANRRRWVRLDRLTRVTATPGPAGTAVHLADADRRRVSVAVRDLAREPRLLDLVATAVTNAEHRGAVRLRPRTRASLYGPRRRRRRGAPGSTPGRGEQR